MLLGIMISATLSELRHFMHLRLTMEIGDVLYCGS